MNNRTTKIPSTFISRDLNKETLYGIKNLSIYAYKDRDDSLTVVGQIFAGKTIKDRFCLRITLYDFDGDVIMSDNSSKYGDVIVTGMIDSRMYFEGFPFEFCLWNVKWSDVSKIEITPENEY